jgi:hypothetical protein
VPVDESVVAALIVARKRASPVRIVWSRKAADAGRIVGDIMDNPASQVFEQTAL